MQPPALQTPSHSSRRERAPSHAGGARAPSPAGGARPHRRHGDVAAELARAMHLSVHERRGRLNALSVTYPDHAPVWLALAEDHLADRRVEEAMACVSRALLLDPALDAQMSPRLDTAYRHHDRRPSPPVTVLRESAAGRPPGPHAASRAQPGTPASAPAAPAPSPGRARSPEQPTAIGKRGGDRRPSEAPEGESIGNRLAQALDVRDPVERLAALERLLDQAPDHPAVLFHFAIEAALASRADDARAAGRRLQQISPRRYQQLYDLAESYWPSRSETPGSAPYAVAMTPEQKAELKTVMLNLGPPAMPDAAVADAPVRERAADQPRRTVLLPVPPSMPPSPPVALPPSAAMIGFPTTYIHAAGSRWTGLRAAIAVAGGVAAGLLVALALVVFVG